MRITYRNPFERFAEWPNVFRDALNARTRDDNNNRRVIALRRGEYSDRRFQSEHTTNTNRTNAQIKQVYYRSRSRKK